MCKGVCMGRKEKASFPTPHTLFNTLTLPKHTGPSYKPYCMPSLTVALLLLEWLHDGVYARAHTVLSPITLVTGSI